MTPVWHFWLRRALRIVAAILLLLVLCGMLLLATVAVKGRWAWSRTQQELAQRGEKLFLADFVPPPVSDDLNFFADPIWSEVSGAADREQDGRPANPLNRLLTSAERETLSARFPRFLAGQTDKPILEMAREARWTAGNLDAPSRAEAARYVLAVLAVSAPVMDHLEKLSKRPAARADVTYEPGIAPDSARFTFLIGAAQFLSYRTWAELQLGQTAEAARDVHTLLRLAKTLATEPMFISLVVRASIDALALAAIDDGIRSHSWTEPQLRGFEEAVASIDLPAHLALALRGERGGFNSFIEALQKSGPDVLYQARRISETPSTSRRLLQRGAISGYAFVFAPGDRALVNEMQQRWIDAADQARDSGLRASQFPGNEGRENPGQTLGRVLVGFTGAAVANGAERTALTQAKAELTQVACALERYRLGNGSYPASLDAVASEFPKGLPRDIVTRRPLQYRLLSPERFALWEAGWNESDEQGNAGAGSGEGDWVWGVW